MAERDLKELLFAQDSARRARNENYSHGLICYREGEAFSYELLISDAGLDEEFKEWKKNHDRR